MSEENLQAAEKVDTGFSESWLALREPADHLARNKTIDKQLFAWFAQQESHSILELGAGTGSNLRYLMPQLGRAQNWRLLDNDAALFARLPELLRSWAEANGARFSGNDTQCKIEHADYSATVEWQVVDLATQLETLSMDNVKLVTAAALLDLASASWLDKVAALVSMHRCACLFTLNYNGEIQWQPEADTDRHVTALLNKHQLMDKGFGPALGPEAGHYLKQALQRLGRNVVTGDSDWVIEPQTTELQMAIIEGWTPAALETDNHAADSIRQWHAVRENAINKGLSTLLVGHTDVLSLP